MWRHGQKLTEFRDEDTNGWSLLHHAVKIEDSARALETVKCLCHFSETNDNFLDC